VAPLPGSLAQWLDHWIRDREVASSGPTNCASECGTWMVPDPPLSGSAIPRVNGPQRNSRSSGHGPHTDRSAQVDSAYHPPPPD